MQVKKYGTRVPETFPAKKEKNVTPSEFLQYYSAIATIISSVPDFF